MEAKAGFCRLISDSGCCSRCSVTFIKCSNREDNEAFQESEENLLNQLNGLECSDGSRAKKFHSSLCYSCLGLLQSEAVEQAVNEIVCTLKDSGFEYEEFGLQISFPLCTVIRISCLWAYFKEKIGDVPKQETRKEQVNTMKSMWRTLVGPRVAAVLRKKFVPKGSADLNVSVVMDYQFDEEECQFLWEIDKEKYLHRAKKRRQYAGKLYTHMSVQDSLSSCTDEDILRICKGPPLEPKCPVSIADITLQRNSLFLAGRYRKYTRNLPQTPWVINGVRKVESSIQEKICEKLTGLIGTSDIKFSSSGREDVDVRSLGRGRPFVVEFANPKRINLSRNELSDVEKDINMSTDAVQISHLQIVSKEDVSVFRGYEEEKTKKYSALCIARDGIKPEQLHKISGITNLKIMQSTPVRVLHRRSLAVREKMVLSLDAEQIDEHFFKVYLHTSAGFYIKEFIHGDFGRTVPSLHSMLGMAVDILALDVVDVILDWPPDVTDCAASKMKCDL